jgi:hypothetical protein
VYACANPSAHANSTAHANPAAFENHNLLLTKTITKVAHANQTWI